MEMIKNFKELQWLNYGARFYDAAVARWWVRDPKAEKAQAWSPYRYGFDNPVSVTDPDGRLEDWVKNLKTGEYVWMDNVTSREETPIGYKYIGKSDYDILRDLGFNKFSFIKKGYSSGFKIEGGNGFLIPLGVKISFYITVFIEPKVEYEINNSYELKRTFKGLRVKTYFTQSVYSADPFLDLKYNGFIKILGQQKIVPLKEMKPPYIGAPNSLTLFAETYLPKEKLYASSLWLEFRAGALSNEYFLMPIVITQKIK